MSGIQDKLSRLEPEKLTQIYKNVFDSEEGQLVLLDLQNRCFIYTTTIVGRIEFNEGMRTVLLHIQTQMKKEKLKELEDNA